MAVFYTLLSVSLVSLISLLGAAFFFLKREIFEKTIFAFIALSSGALLATAFFDLLPGSFSVSPETTPALILFGIIFFFVVEKLINWHHCPRSQDCPGERPIGWLSLIGDGLHNFVDGAAIATAFATDLKLGWLTTVAVVLHEIPHELSDFSLLIYAGFGRSKALWLNLLSALTAILGAVVVILANQQDGTLNQLLLPITTGNFIYIAATDLFPELHKHKSLRSTFGEVTLILIGIFLILFFKNFLG